METARYIPTQQDKFYKAIEDKQFIRVDCNSICSEGICFESTYLEGDKELGKIHSITYFRSPHVKDSKVINFWLCK